MAISYTNHKGKKYYLCYLINKKGQKQYFFTPKTTAQQADNIPSGFEVKENESGQVVLIKSKKQIQAKPATQDQSSYKSSPASSSKAKRRKQKQKAGADMSSCPVCFELFPFAKLKWHIRDNHPEYTPAMAISASIQNDPHHKQTVKRPLIQRRQNDKEKARQIRAEALHVDQTICGWCYKPIYEVWLPTGRNRYYEDEELMIRHYCTRPVHWDPDHSGGPIEP